MITVDVIEIFDAKLAYFVLFAALTFSGTQCVTIGYTGAGGLTQTRGEFPSLIRSLISIRRS